MNFLICRLKIDELNLTIYKLENEVNKLRSMNELRDVEQIRMQKFKNITKNNSSSPSKTVEKQQKL
jgi:hypothetical protein